MGTACYSFVHACYSQGTTQFPEFYEDKKMKMFIIHTISQLNEPFRNFLISFITSFTFSITINVLNFYFMELLKIQKETFVEFKEFIKKNDTKSDNFPTGTFQFFAVL